MMLKIFAEKISNLSRNIGNIAALLILPLIILIVYATSKRYFFDSMPSWGYEVPIFIYGIFFLMGGILCQLKGKHVNVDILPKYVSPKWQRRLCVISNVMIAIACFTVAYYASKWAYESTLINERSVHQTDFNPTVWWFKWFVPVSFLLIALQSIANIILPPPDSDDLKPLKEDK